MKYTDFVKIEKELMDKAEDCMNKGLYIQWSEKMSELANLQSKYIDERMAALIKGGSSKSNKKAEASRINGKKGGRPKKWVLLEIEKKRTRKTVRKSS